MYTDEKTRRLNRFHAWFPTGIVIGGLIVYLFTNIGLTDWRWAMAIMLLPTFAYGFMFLNKKFPETERVTSGYSYKDMLKALQSPVPFHGILYDTYCIKPNKAQNQWIGPCLPM